MKARGSVHFVGSVPLADADVVFRTLAARFAGLLARIPDGETGDRINWLQFQEEAFAATDALAPVEVEADYRNAGAQRKQHVQFALKPGRMLAAGALPPLGYEEAAHGAYAHYRRLRNAKVIPPGCRFMVALPSPYNVISWAIADPSRRAVEPAYEATLLRELDAICAAIPAADLAIQWDCAHDMQAFDGARIPWFEPAREGIIERLVRIGERVPAAVELGYHLCYGSFGGRHFVEPRDSGAMTELANGVLDELRRPLQFLHMPVPVERTDDAYFAPLEHLRLGSETTLSLGLVHATDTLEQARCRIRAARRFVPEFGVSAECGFGRLAREALPGLLDAHERALEALHSI